MNANLENLTAADLRRAADISEEIENLQAELAQLLSGKKKPGRKPAKKKAGAKRSGRKPGPKPATATATAKKVAKKKGGRKRTAAEKKAQSDKMKAIWAKKKREAKKK